MDRRTTQAECLAALGEIARRPGLEQLDPVRALVGRYVEALQFVGTPKTALEDECRLLVSAIDHLLANAQRQHGAGDHGPASR